MKVFFLLILFPILTNSQSIDLGFGGSIYKHNFFLLNGGIIKNYDNVNIGFRVGVGKSEEKSTDSRHNSTSTKMLFSNYEILLGFRNAIFISGGFGTLTKQISVNNLSSLELTLPYTLGCLIRFRRDFPFTLGVHYTSDFGKNGLGFNFMVWL